MLVSFGFYIQKFIQDDSEYRITLTNYTEDTYSKTIVKEGFIYSFG